MQEWPAPTRSFLYVRAIAPASSRCCPGHASTGALARTGVCTAVARLVREMESLRRVKDLSARVVRSLAVRWVGVAGPAAPAQAEPPARRVVAGRRRDRLGRGPDRPVQALRDRKKGEEDGWGQAEGRRQAKQAQG